MDKENISQLETKLIAQL